MDDESFGQAGEALRRAEGVRTRTEQVGRRHRSRVHLATGGATAVSTLVAGAVVQTTDASPAVWFPVYAALTLLVRAWVLRQPLQARPSRRMLSVLIVGQSIAFGLAAAVESDLWWIWPAAALAQFALYAVGAWRAGR